VLFAVMAISLLVYDHLQQRVPASVFWLALALIAAVFARMVETVRAQSRELQLQHPGTLSDQVPGLHDRGRLEADVKAVLALPGEHRVLVLLELEGLRSYNDRFGYAAGDDLLRLFGQNLVQAVAPLGGGGYWLDATRFAALVPAGERQLGEVVLAATASLRELERDQLISSAYGEVSLPDDTQDAELAFQIAGQRLSSQKQRQHRSARRQAHAVLIAALLARHPELNEQLRTAAFRAISLGRRLGTGSEEIDDIALAAELQDIGLLAMPDRGLERRVSLGDGEMMTRDRSAAGAKIIAAAPGLTGVADLVRSSAESFDGSGYPDGKVGEAIPLGSRIIAVAGAFAAMTAPRSDRVAASVEDVLAELRRRAGTQFDPQVVEALAADLADEASAEANSPSGQAVS
jgi:HD-GYP domain-containing protein (c-di-GMP phosphodiesterase class II)